MNKVVLNYVGDQKCCIFIDIKMNDPWTRVIINENINKLPLQDFDTFIKKRERKLKLQKIQTLLK